MVLSHADHNANSTSRASPQAFYVQLAIYACGNALAIIIGLILWNLWAVLSDFRNAMLYAMLCSIALRGPKDWLVRHLETRLAQNRSVASALLSMLALPLTALTETWDEARDLLLKWRQNVLEYQQELQKRQAMRRAMSGAMSGPLSGAATPTTPHATPSSPRSPLSPRQAAAAATAAGKSQSPSRASCVRTSPPLVPISAAAAAAAAAVANEKPPPTQTLPVLLSVYAKAGVKALHTRRTSKKRRRRAALRRAPAVPSAVLFRWLFRACVAWLSYNWVRAVWSATLQLVVLITTAVVVLGLLPLLYCLSHWYLGASVFSPLKTPTGKGTQSRSPYTPTSGRSTVTPLRRPRFTPLTRTASRGKLIQGWPRSQAGDAAAGAGRGVSGAAAAAAAAVPLHTPSPFASMAAQQQPAGAAGGPGQQQVQQQGPAAAAAAAGGAASDTRWRRVCSYLGAVGEGCRELLCSLDSGLRSALRRNLHSLVSLLLIAALLLGSTGLAAFLTVRVVQEGRAAVMGVRELFPTAWAGVTISGPMLLAEVPASPRRGALSIDAAASRGGVCLSRPPWQPAGSDGTQQCDPGSAPPASAASAANVGQPPRPSPAAGAGAGAAPGSGKPLKALPSWLASYQSGAQVLIQRSLPGVAAWVEAQFDAFMARHNLTAAAGDLRLLYETVQGPRECSGKERGRLLVAAARADLELSEALQAEKEAYSRAERLKLRLTSAVQQLARVRSESSGAGAQQAAAVLTSSQQGGSSVEEQHEGVAGLPTKPRRSLLSEQRQQEQMQQAKQVGGESTPAAAADKEETSSSRLEAAETLGRSQHTAAAAAASADAVGAGAEGEASRRSSPASARPLPSHARILLLEQEVVAADNELSAAKAVHRAALEALAAAQREAQAAEGRLQLCRSEGEQEGGEGQNGQHLLPGLAGEVGRRLQSAYSMLWHRQLREGWSEMKSVAQLCVDALRNATAHHHAAGGQASPGEAGAGSGGSFGSTSPHHPHHLHHRKGPAAGAAVADLGSLQRLLWAAADPLIIAGRALAGAFALSVGSTTAAAIMGGLGVLRLGLGLAKFGMQLTLFLALLYYLLAAQREPLVLAVGVLPLSEGGKQRAAAAFTKALGGVFISSVKLVAFHGTFTWLTFRVFSVPLAYTATVACAACALLPFIPTYVIALPACLMFGAQGRLVSALLFFVLHFAAYYLGDTLILEDIPGGHPYLMSLGILGGIYTFDNPLQGCLLGPILLSLLSVFYNLHSEFMSGGGGGSGDQGPPTPSLRALWGIGGHLHHLHPRKHSLHAPPRVVISSPATPSPSPVSQPGGLVAGLGGAGAASSRGAAGLLLGGAAAASEGRARPSSAGGNSGGRSPVQRQRSLQGEAGEGEGSLQQVESMGQLVGQLEESISLVGPLGLRRRSGSRQSVAGGSGSGREGGRGRPGSRSSQLEGGESGEDDTVAESRPAGQGRQRFSALLDLEEFSFDGQHI